MADFTVEPYNITAIEWTGTNLDAMVTHIGAAVALSYVYGEGLRLAGVLVPVGDNVAKKTVGGAYVGILNDADLASLYNPAV